MLLVGQGPGALVNSLRHTSAFPRQRVTRPQVSPRLGHPALGDSPSQALGVSENRPMLYQMQRDALTRLPHLAHGQPLVTTGSGPGVGGPGQDRARRGVSLFLGSASASLQVGSGH